MLRHRVSGLWWLRLLLLPFSILFLAMALAALGTTSSWFLPVGLGGYAGDLILPAFGIRLIVETPNRIEGQGEYDCLLALGENVASACSVYYWPQENRAKDDNGKIGILHVKCAVADGRWLFLSSANLTEYAFTLNMELGLLITGGNLPGQVEAHFHRLIEAGVLAKP